MEFIGEMRTGICLITFDLSVRAEISGENTVGGVRDSPMPLQGQVAALCLNPGRCVKLCPD